MKIRIEKKWKKKIENTEITYKWESNENNLFYLFHICKFYSFFIDHQSITAQL